MLGKQDREGTACETIWTKDLIRSEHSEVFWAVGAQSGWKEMKMREELIALGVEYGLQPEDCEE